MQLDRIIRLSQFILIALILSLSPISGSFSVANAEDFPDVSLIEKSLKRGISTKEDVRNLLGNPDGFGTAIWPPDHRFFRVWYYEDMRVVGMRSVEGGVQELNMRHQILTIYFDGENYDGFNWTSNVVPSKVR